MRKRLASLFGRLRAIAYRDRGEIRRAAITFAAGLTVLLLMQIPVVERSFLGGVDREMLDAAFRMRADTLRDTADPAVLIDIDDRSLVGEPKQGAPASPPSATTSRLMIAQLLEFVRTAPPESAPRVVVVDVDLATPTPEQAEGVALLRETLAAWATTPSAPPLLLARSTYPPAAVGVTGDIGVLPPTPYDDIVTPAPNIFWGLVRMVSDKEGVIREFMPFECAVVGGRVQPIYSVVLLAYGFLAEDGLPPKSNARHWIEQSESWCRERPNQSIWHGERINFHLSFERENFETRVWPDLPDDWRGHAVCGHGDPAVFRRLSAVDVVDAGLEGSRAVLCRRIVIIGGTNTPAADWQQTPLEEMAGPVIIANAIRGLQMSNGGLKQIHFSLQVLVLLAVSLAISMAFTATRRLRERFARMKATRKKQVDPLEAIQLVVLNPVVLNWTVALAAHFVGIGLLLISLDLSFWGYLSAPAIGAAITETIQEFADD